MDSSVVIGVWIGCALRLVWIVLSSVERLFGAILSVHEDCIRMSVGGSVFYHTADWRQPVKQVCWKMLKQHVADTPACSQTFSMWRVWLTMGGWDTFGYKCIFMHFELDNRDIARNLFKGVNNFREVYSTLTKHFDVHVTAWKAYLT